MIGILNCDRPHQGTLAGIAVAAGAEYHNELSPGVRPQRLQRLCQRIGLVRVVDEDRRAVALADPLKPALGAFKMFER